MPTGAEKTAAAIVAWLWRLNVDPANTPRRLVYRPPTSWRGYEAKRHRVLRRGIHSLPGGRAAEFKIRRQNSALPLLSFIMALLLSRKESFMGKEKRST